MPGRPTPFALPVRRSERDRIDPAEAARRLAGTLIDGDAGGSFLVRETLIPLATGHGSDGRRLASLTDAAGPALALAAGDPELAARSPREALFFDIETTALGGGAGVFAFVLGAGRFEAGGFRITQHLLVDPGAEAALLADFAERAAGASGLVSFCGRGFDAPRVRDRARFHQVPDPLPGGPHLDLHPPLRRLFGSRVPRCRLGILERAILGIRRPDDLPSAECPEAWFAFQRTGATAPLDRVLAHNLDDVISLPLLAAELAARTTEPAAGEDAVAKAAALVRDRRHDEAIRVVEAAPPAVASSRLELRTRIALAIHLEHRVRDLDRAATQATIAASVAARLPTLPDDRRSVIAAAVGRRLERLDRKRRGSALQEHPR